MNNALAVHIQNPFHDLVKHKPNMLGGHLLGVKSDDIHQILGAVLKDKVDGLKGLAVAGPHDGLQFHDVFVPPQDPQEP
jgi:hypothetical protein